MKNLVFISSLLLSVIFASSSFARDAVDSASESLVSFGANPCAKTGMSPEEVLSQLGAPSEKLSDNHWAYWNFRIAGAPRGARGDALVVVFTNGRVSLLRFTERSLVEAAIAKARVNAAKSSAIAKK